MFPTDANVRGELVQALRARYRVASRARGRARPKQSREGADAGAAGQKIRRWLSFFPGQILYMPARGPGRIVELNPALDVIRLEFAGVKLPFSLVSAEKTLVALPEGHFLREKLEHPEETRELAEREPAEAVRRLLASFDRPIALGDVKDHFGGLIPEAKWGAFWSAARKHKQLLVSGTGKSSMVAWSASAGAAEDSIRRAFASASPAAKIDLARKQGKRSKELAREFAARPRGEARRAAARSPALAWELSFAAAAAGDR